MSLFWGIVDRRRRRRDRDRGDAARPSTGARGQLLHGRRPRLRRVRRARDGLRDLRRLRHLPRLHDVRRVARRCRGRGARRRAAVRDGAVPRAGDPRSTRPASSSATGAPSCTTSGRGWRRATSATPSTPGRSSSSGRSAAADTSTRRRADGVREVARPDLRPGRGAARPRPRRGRHHADDGLDRPPPDRGDRLRLHAVLRRQRGDEALAGDAHRVRDDDRRRDAPRDPRARQPVPTQGSEASARWRWSDRCAILERGSRGAERRGDDPVRRRRATRRRRDGRAQRQDHRLELAATLLLALAAIATAWATYQSSVWRGKQAEAQSASIAARVESTRQAHVANRQAQVDVALFTQWVDAYAQNEGELASTSTAGASATSSSLPSMRGSRRSRARTRRHRSRRSRCRSTDSRRRRRPMRSKARRASSAGK